MPFFDICVDKVIINCEKINKSMFLPVYVGNRKKKRSFGMIEVKSKYDPS